MGLSIEIYLIQALHGLVYGMLLFLVASGLTLIFGMMGVLNLAHASFYMLGAYFAYRMAFHRILRGVNDDGDKENSFNSR